jgi:GxxExxY protein
MHWDPANYKHQELTEAIIHDFYEVYNELGHGFLESVYEEALFRVLKANGVSVQRQYPLPVWFRGDQIGDFRADLVVADKVVVELKAVKALESFHEAQLLNYLRSIRPGSRPAPQFRPQPKTKAPRLRQRKETSACFCVNLRLSLAFDNLRLLVRSGNLNLRCSA